MKLRPKLTHVCFCSAMLLTFSLASTSLAAAGDGVESDGFNLGVGLDLFTGINTNVFFEDGDGAKGETNAAPTVRLVPSLTLNTVNPRNVDLSAGADLGLLFFFGDDTISSQSSLEWNVGMSSHFFPKSAVSFRVLGDVNRNNQASNKEGEDNYSRNIFGLGGVLGIHPGGRALQGFLGYKYSMFRFDTFSDSEIFNSAFASTDLGSLNKNQHALNLRTLYEFLPKSVLSFVADWRFIDYEQPLRTPPGSDSVTGLKNVNSKPLRLKAGFNGLLTEGIGATLFGGYGNGFYEEGANVNTFLIDAELSYNFGFDRTNTVRLGYSKGFRDATLGSFYTTNRIYLSYAQSLMDKKLLFTAEAGLDIRNYVLENNGDTNVGTDSGVFELPTELNDTYINVDVGLRYQLTSFAHVGASYGLLSNVTNSNSDLIAGLQGIQGRDFLQHIILLNAGVVY